MAANHIRKMALVGASGNVGDSTLKSLLKENPKIEITIISRADSNATFPSSPQIKVKKGSYDDPAFLQSAFEGNDLAMFALSFMASQAQTQLIDAAAKAGVKWIIPNEYAGDGKNEKFFNSVPLFQPKVAVRKQLEELGVDWIGVATNPWTELSIDAGMFGFNIHERRATLYSGSGPFNSSSIAQVGLGIARLLSLPITNPSNPRASLSHYANNYVYISSFSVTQEKLFDSIKLNSGTSDADWTIEKDSIENWIKTCKEQLAQGNFMAGAGMTYAFYMGEGYGGDYEAKAKEDREILGLNEEKLDEVVQGALAEPKKYAF